MPTEPTTTKASATPEKIAHDYDCPCEACSLLETEVKPAPEKTAHDYEITRAPGGTGERREKLSTLQILDLWHIAQANNPADCELILDVWHLAHDLKRELATAFELVVALQGALQERTAQRDRLALLATIDDESAERIGKAIAEDFGLKRSREHADRYVTQNGTFTNKGIARRARRHIEEGGQQ
jgi:hypothetical protein